MSCSVTLGRRSCIRMAVACAVTATCVTSVTSVAFGSPLLPARLLDTRSAGRTIDGAQQGSGTISADSTLRLHVTGRGGARAAENSVAPNVTATRAAAAGFVTVFPCSGSRLRASNLHTDPGVDVAALVVSRTDVAGDVCFFTLQDVDLVADVNGFVTVFPCITPPLASNLNYSAGQTIPNSAISKVSPNGDVFILNSQPLQLLADASSAFTG